MKLRKLSWRVCLATTLGFVAGVALFHSRTVNAQYGRTVTVQEVQVLGFSGTATLKGSQVVGFSCVQSERGAECYVASQ